MDTIAQLLAADSQLGLGTQPGLAAALVSQICTVHEEYCTGSDQQYTSAAECASFLSSIQVCTIVFTRPVCYIPPASLVSFMSVS